MNNYLSFLKGRTDSSNGFNSSEVIIEEDDLDMDELRGEIESLRGQLVMLQGSAAQNTTNSSQVCQVTEMIKMQAFYENDPELWFSIIESQFAARRIVSEKTKYMQVVANLNCATAALVKDVIKLPFVEGHYERLKAALTAIYAESATQKFQKLISKTDIGDMRPSQFLHHMKSLADDSISETLIKQLWIQRLPSASRAVLSASNDSLDNLGKMADKMWEVSDHFCVASIGGGVKAQSNGEQFAKALNKITSRLEALERKEHTSRRDATPRRFRNRSQSRQRGNSEFKDRELCWYHFKFGEKAQKCRDPCQFKSESKN